MELEKFNIDELKEIADKLGVSYKSNIGEDTLREKITTFIAENPECLNEDTAEDVKASVENKLDGAKDQLAEMDALDRQIAEATAKKNAIDQSTKIAMRSKFRGVINTSLGDVDFGTTGEAFVTARQAKFLSKMKGYEIC